MKESGSYFPTTRMSVMGELSQGVNRAWHTFFSIYAPIVHRFSRHAGLGEHDADEVLSNVMRNLMQAVRGGFEVNHEIGRFRDYLRKITNREIADVRRRVRERQAGHVPVDDVQVEDDQPSVETGWAEFERQERLWACLERMRNVAGPVKLRDIQAFEQYALEGRPVEQVATEFGISTSRVYAIKHEVTQHLRRIREQLDEILGEV